VIVVLILEYAVHQRAVRLSEPEPARDSIVDVYDPDIDRSICHRAARNDRFDRTAHAVYRNGKPNAIPVRFRSHSRIDTDKAAVHIDERPAAAARVYNSIRLQQFLVRPHFHAGRLPGADDPQGNRLLEPERVSDRHDDIAGHYRIGISESRGTNPSFECSLSTAISALTSSPTTYASYHGTPPRVEMRSQVRGILVDHVRISDHVPVGAYNNAGAELLDSGACLRLSAMIATVDCRYAFTMER